jgi:hypothetical protein
MTNRLRRQLPSPVYPQVLLQHLRGDKGKAFAIRRAAAGVTAGLFTSVEGLVVVWPWIGAAPR